MTYKISGGKVISNDMITEKNVYISDNKIIAVTNDELPFDKEIDAAGLFVAPGFIDMHVHGGGGYDFIDEEDGAVEKAVEFHLAHGTTAIYPTVLAAEFDDMKWALSNVREVMKKYPQIMGVHMEGPYFSLEYKGAQPEKCITNPIKEQYEYLLENYPGVVKKWSYAPELPGSLEFLDCLKKHGVVASAGHTSATYDQMKPAIDNGLTMITHLFSCTSTITREKGFRKLGVIETAFLEDDVIAELIADGKHLPLELLRMTYKLKGADKLCLVTDALRGAGLPDGEKTFVGSKEKGVPCIIEDGVAKLMDRSAFGGSIATTDRLLRTAISAGISLTDGVKMLTKTPARAMGLETKGELKAGFDADIVIFDNDINVKHVISMGTLVK